MHTITSLYITHMCMHVFSHYLQQAVVATWFFLQRINISAYTLYTHIHVRIHASIKININ